MINQLHINLTKSYYISFTKNMTINENLRQPSDYPQLKINDAVIKEVDEIKFLGILLDKKLSFKPHVNYLCKKLCCCIGSLKRMSNFIHEKLKINLYHTLFESHLSYGISVWGGIGFAKINKLFTVQKRCIRMFFGDYNRFKNKFMTCVRVRLFENQKLGSSFFEKEHIKPLFNGHKILAVHNLYAYHCTIEIYKILKLRSPMSIYSCISISKRKQNLLLTDNPINLFMSAKLWNRFCKDIIGDSMDFPGNIGSVKGNLKRILFQNQSKYDKKLWRTLNYTYT